MKHCLSEAPKERMSDLEQMMKKQTATYETVDAQTKKHSRKKKKKKKKKKKRINAFKRRHKCYLSSKIGLKFYQV